MPRSALVQSVLRGIEIVELVARSESGLSLPEICEGLGLKQPTAHNLIRTLVSRGYLEKTQRPVRYRLGASAGRLAGQYADHALVRRASKVMTALFEQLDEILQPPFGRDCDTTITLARDVAGEVTMALRVWPDRPTVIERPGRSYHPYGSAAALVFQAYWDPEERRQFRQRHAFWEFGQSLWQTEQRLDAFLEEVRAVGYAAPQIHGPDVLRVAVPVFGRGHELLAALGAGRWRRLTRSQRQRYIDVAVAAARRIGEAGDPVAGADPPEVP